MRNFVGKKGPVFLKRKRASASDSREFVLFQTIIPDIVHQRGGKKKKKMKGAVLKVEISSLRFFNTFTGLLRSSISKLTPPSRKCPQLHSCRALSDLGTSSHKHVATSHERNRRSICHSSLLSSQIRIISPFLAFPHNAKSLSRKNHSKA